MQLLLTLLFTAACALAIPAMVLIGWIPTLTYRAIRRAMLKREYERKGPYA